MDGEPTSSKWPARAISQDPLLAEPVTPCSLRLARACCSPPRGRWGSSHVQGQGPEGTPGAGVTLGQKRRVSRLRVLKDRGQVCVGLPGALCKMAQKSQNVTPRHPPSTALGSPISHNLGKERGQGEKQAGPAQGLSRPCPSHPRVCGGGGGGEPRRAPWRRSAPARLASQGQPGRDVSHSGASGLMVKSFLQILTLRIEPLGRPWWSSG